ncbi:MAG: aminopeptidase N [Alphaproteobacteria bacterium]|nr:aminopeptidase N [Alphaproteobacteria bacterium]
MTKRPIYYLSDYKPTPYSIPKIDLEFYLGTEHTIVKARLEIRTEQQKLVPLILNGDDLDLQAISINGQIIDKSAYRASPNELEILQIPATNFTLEITTKINPDSNLQLMGLYRSNGIFCTQCEAEGFRRITYFYDRPDVLSVYTVYIEADKTKCPILLSNGNLIETGDLNENRHFARWHDPFPKPCYLFALVAGDLDVLKDSFITASKKKVDLAIYTEKAKTSRAAFAMDSLKRAMIWDEKQFSREYDLALFNIVAVSDFNMGAMENKGLNIFNDKCILADKETATDSDYAGVERVVAHEYFHNWTGNRITCRDWFQLCLKEGLTVYRDQRFRAAERSAAVQRINDVRQLIASQFSVDAGPLSHPVRPNQYSEINNFYTTTVYEKGAELVRMLHTMLGEQLFHKAMDRYFEIHDGQACTVEDFVACFEHVSNQDLSQFMLWYSQSGTPHIKALISFENSTLKIQLEQSLQQGTNNQKLQPMSIPINFNLLSQQGQLLQHGLLLLTKEKDSFEFHALADMPYVSLLCGLSSPVTIEKKYVNGHSAEQDRLFLIKHDKDPVNIWHNLQQLSLEKLAAIIKNYTTNNNVHTSELDPDIAQAMQAIANNSELEPALKATYLSLPSEREIAQYLKENLNPEHIYKARCVMQENIAKANIEIFKDILTKFAPQANYSPIAEEAGKRALYNIAIFYISLYENSPTRAYEQYNNADNLTMRVAALSMLLHKFPKAENTNQALKDFENLYAETPLVMDKWFALQATVSSTESLAQVKALCKHAAFSFNNPNRVRALIGSFAYGNLVNFHAEDGAGYQFVSKIILQIDPHNPHLAANLLGAFGDWQKFEPKRYAQAKAVLENMLEKPTISNDIADILSRMLKKEA